MPGYRHYSDCSCGWCDKSGFGRFDAAPAKATYTNVSARGHLERNSAGGGRAACFVNPNARCPECFAAVFYYQNEFGSRVFFDDLGPPWPKHKCTDRRTWTSTERSQSPTKRARGLTMELIEAATTLGRYQGIRFGSNGIPLEWALVQVRFVSRSGSKNKVCGEYLEAVSDLLVYFTFDSTNPMIDTGDIVSIKGEECSLYDISQMRTKSYKTAIFQDDSFTKQLAS